MLSIFYLIFIRICAGIFVWLIIFVFFVCLGGIGGLFFYDGEENLANESLNANLTSEQRKHVAYGIWGLWALCLLTFLCCFSRIRLAIAILKTGASYIGSVMTSLFVPLILVIPQAIFLILYVAGFVILYTAKYGDQENLAYPNGYVTVLTTEEI